MEINLLGPLEARHDEVILTPSAPKLRTVLSLLVVRANGVVRTEQLIDELWEDNPPTSVTTTLQTYIYQLRKLLRLAVLRGKDRCHHDPGVTALHTSPYGYVLSLPPGTLDSSRFERLADRGRAALEAGEIRTAAETLSACLRIWRGNALVDVGRGPVLQAEALRLEEQYKNALEWRIDADLQLGRHNELLGELTRLAAEQPTHEGFQAKLMLALYRAGRRSEALNVYQRARSALAAELGLDPTGELQRLHRAVLAADRSLDTPRPREVVRTGRRSRPPRQLPPEGPALVGRTARISTALDALSTGHEHTPSVVVVVGPPGVGKSALCTRVGHLAGERYPDGQLYARLLTASGEPVDPGEVLAEFLRSVGVPDERIPASSGERCRLFRTWTADRRVLVTVEDAVSAAQLQPLVPASGGCGMLVSGRRRLSAPAVTSTVELAPLTAEDGMRLLTGVLGEQRVESERDAARELVRDCGGLPSVLHSAAAVLRVRPHWRIPRVSRWLHAALAPTAPPEQLTLHASVEQTFRVAPPEVRHAFRRLSDLDVPRITPADAARMLDTTERRADAVLEDLVEFQLAEAVADQHGTPCYRIPPLVRAIGRRLPTGTLAACPATHRPPPRPDEPPAELRVTHEPVS